MTENEKQIPSTIPAPPECKGCVRWTAGKFARFGWCLRFARNTRATDFCDRHQAKPEAGQ